MRLLTIPKYAEALKDNGAERITLNEHCRINDIEQCTHIISTTSDFPDYDKAVDSYIPVVKPLWIEDSLRKGKQSLTRGYSPDLKRFFSDIVLACGDIPEGDKDAIIAGVLAMGGTYSEPMSKSVTHIVALTQDHRHCQTAINKNLACKMVLPHWFDDCLKLGKKIDERPYLLPEPEILNHTHSGPVYQHRENQDAYIPSSKAISDELSDAVIPQSSPSSNRKALNCFGGQHVMLSKDLDIGSRLRGIFEELIQSGDGFVTQDIKIADTYVGQYRDGPDYIYASHHGITVGNLLWLYHLITRNEWTSPMRRLLHYPVPRNGMDCFKGLKFSVSNYTGEARIYIQKLIEASGAECTGAMNQTHTHLITAHDSGAKCEAAKEWGIDVVNHLWLEESYASCQTLPLTNPRYSYFPKRTNLGEVVGQTGIDSKVLKMKVWGRALDGNPRKAKARSIPSSREPSPVKAKMSTASDVTMQGSGSTILGDDTHENSASSPLGAKQQRSRDRTRTPIANRIAPGKENETPSVTGGRGAKERAVNRLHLQSFDIADYEKETKRKGGVTHGRPRNSDVGNAKKEKEVHKSKKRSHDESEEDGGSETDETVAPVPTKKQKKIQKSDVDHRLLLTGVPEYADDGKKYQHLKNRLQQMGILVTEDPTKATILCAPKVMRTRNFVVALAFAPLVVGTSFLDHCLKHNSPPPTAPHALGNDRDTKEQFGFCISESVERAKVNKGRMLRGWKIFCTEAVKGGFETYKDIVKYNGGQCLLWKGRQSLTVTKQQLVQKAGEEGQSQDGGDEDEDDIAYLISGTSEKEIELWTKFRGWAEKNDLKPRIVSKDWLLISAMAQQIEWKEEYELSTDDV
ncbi:MAG: hypothetical protein M1822_004053 [Bathelium mastoideum]|nr:MAG: hypothetical protein M1822_004053 [Bathelium mastoideum]